MPSWLTNLLALLAVGSLALLAMELASIPAWAAWGANALTLAICAGIVLGNLGYRRIAGHCQGTERLCRHYLLRLGIVLYGFRVTFQAIEQLGGAGVAVALLVLITTLLAGYWIGVHGFGLSRSFALLIATGSAVCGAAAVLAAAPVLRTQARETAVAMATVVVFGTVGMFLYPLMWRWLMPTLSEPSASLWFGVYIGSTLHEVAQVVAAASVLGDEAANAAVVTKMVRVLALAPVLIVLALWGMTSDRDNQDAPDASSPSASPWKLGARAAWRAMPWFAVGFVAVIALHSSGVVPEVWEERLRVFDTWLLCCAMFAIGLSIRIGGLMQGGARPLWLGAVLFLFLVIGGAALNLLVRWF